MRHAMTDDELRNQIERHEHLAVGYYTGEVAQEQAQAMDYYLSKPFGTEEEGKSQIVSSDVWDVVEGMAPMILRPFVSSEDVVRFNPVGPDDEDKARQESDYINWVVTQKNDVFNELMAWVKTGLLQKNGVVKYWWDTSTKKSIERYFGVPDDEYTLIIQADEVEVIEHNEHPGEMTQDPQTGQPAQGSPTHDVTIRVSLAHGEAKYKVIPPEEFLISKDADSPNPKSARFVQHRRKMTLSDVRAMGYEVDDDQADGGDDTLFSLQYQARRSGEENAIGSDEALDPASREVLFRETYIMVDADGDGLAELRKVCILGDKIVCNEETEEIPFCAWTPYTMPFKFYGRCPADESIEIQKIKSTVLRQTMDNVYTLNNNRNFVSDKVNLDDLLDNQIAGVVRVSGDVVSNHVMPAPIQPIGQITLPIIEYLDSAKENRTGFTRYNQGSDADSLNKTATGIRLIQQAGNVRSELISRSFAEQGLAPLMLGMHGLCRRHATKSETMRLRGDWVTVDPRDWVTRYDMTVAVGLGNADQQMKLQAVQMLQAEQKQLVQAGIVTPDNFYNGAAKMVEAVGFKNPEQFFTPPGKMPQQPPQPNPDEMKAQSAMQLEQMRQQHAEQMEGMKQQAEMARVLESDRMTAQLEHAKSEMQAASDEADRRIEVWKAQLASDTQVQIKEMDIRSAQELAQDRAEGEEIAAGTADQETKQDKMAEAMNKLFEATTQMSKHLTAPKQIIRDANGRATGVQSVIETEQA